MSGRGVVGPNPRGTQRLDTGTASLAGGAGAAAHAPPARPAGTGDRRHTGPLPVAEAAPDLARKLLELAEKKRRLRELEYQQRAAAERRAQQQAADARKSFWQKAWDGMKDTAAAAVDAARSLVRKASSEVGELTRDIAALERDLEAAVKTGAQVVAEAVGDAVTEVEEAAEATLAAGKKVVGKVVDTGAKVVETAVDAGEKVIDAVGDAAQEIAETVVEAGEAVVEAGGKVVDKVAAEVKEYALHELALDGPDKFHDKGELSGITSKLGMGDSVSLTIEAGATIPLEEFAIPNAKLDAGGTLKLTRVPRRDASGKVLNEPRDAQGNPPSEIVATLELTGRAGLSAGGKAGIELTAEAAGYEVGAKASVGGEIEGGVKGRVAYSFAFDPTSARDMDVLTGLAKVTARASLEQAVPGIGPVLAGHEIASHADLFADFGRHVYTIEGEGGLYAQASASASLKVGIFKARPEPGQQEGLTGKVAAKGVEKLKLDIAKASLGGSGSAVLGARQDFRTGDTTIYVKVEGQIGGSASVLGQGVGGNLQGSRTAAFTYGQDGKLKAVSVTDETTKEHFKGIMTTVEDVYGRPLDQGVMAQVKDTDMVRVRYDLKPEEVARIAKTLDGGGSAAMLPYVQTLQMSKGNAMLGDRSVTAYHKDTLGFKFAFQADLGAQIGLRFKLEAAHEQEQDLARR